MQQVEVHALPALVNAGPTLLLDGGMLIVSVNGFMYGLDALTGREIWQNEMEGFGYGVASLVSVNGVTGASLPSAVAEQHAAASVATSSAA